MPEENNDEWKPVFTPSGQPTPFQYRSTDGVVVCTSEPGQSISVFQLGDGHTVGKIDVRLAPKPLTWRQKPAML